MSQQDDDGYDSPKETQRKETQNEGGHSDRSKSSKESGGSSGRSKDSNQDNESRRDDTMQSKMSVSSNGESSIAIAASKGRLVNDENDKNGAKKDKKEQKEEENKPEEKEKSVEITIQDAKSWEKWLTSTFNSNDKNDDWKENINKKEKKIEGSIIIQIGLNGENSCHAYREEMNHFQKSKEKEKSRYSKAIIEKLQFEFAMPENEKDNGKDKEEEKGKEEKADTEFGFEFLDIVRRILSVVEPRSLQFHPFVDESMYTSLKSQFGSNYVHCINTLSNRVEFVNGKKIAGSGSRTPRMVIDNDYTLWEYELAKIDILNLIDTKESQIEEIKNEILKKMRKEEMLVKAEKEKFVAQFVKNVDVDKVDSYREMKQLPTKVAEKEKEQIEKDVRKLFGAVADKLYNIIFNPENINVLLSLIYVTKEQRFEAANNNNNNENENWMPLEKLLDEASVTSLQNRKHERSQEMNKVKIVLQDYKDFVAPESRLWSLFDGTKLPENANGFAMASQQLIYWDEKEKKNKSRPMPLQISLSILERSEDSHTEFGRTILELLHELYHVLSRGTKFALVFSSFGSFYLPAGEQGTIMISTLTGGELVQRGNRYYISIGKYQFPNSYCYTFWDIHQIDYIDFYKYIIKNDQLPNFWKMNKRPIKKLNDDETAKLQKEWDNATEKIAQNGTNASDSHIVRNPLFVLSKQTAADYTLPHPSYARVSHTYPPIDE